MNTFDAWYLPTLDSRDLLLRTAQFGAMRARVPELTADQLSAVLKHLRESAPQLAAVSRPDLVNAIATAAARVLASDETSKLLHAVTGYSHETLADLLQYMSRDWSAESLNELLRSEIGEADVQGSQLAFHVFSGNVPGVAVTSIIRSLLVRTPTLGKTASGEPLLSVLFARELDEVAPHIAQSLAVTYWPGGTDEMEALAVAAADTVVVYGGEGAVASISERAGPGTMVLEHGPRLSFGVVGKQADPASLPEEIAEAVAAYDQQGCVSPHVVYVERGGAIEPRDLAQAVAGRLRVLAATKPRRKLSHAEALAVHDARTRAEFRAIGGENVDVFASDDTSYTVIYDERISLPTSCLNRTLYVIAIDDAHELHAVLKPYKAVLQSVALAGFSSDQMMAVSKQLTDAGATRITTFSELPWPPMWWQHDGRGPLRELLSMSDNPL